MGLIAAVASTVCFPVRNVFLKRLQVEHPLQKYAVISILGVAFLLPALVLKYIVTKTLFVLRWKEGALSAVCHFVYNVASITVLQSISPVSHSILNLLKRVVVVLTNILYFRSPPISWDVTLSLLVFFVGLAFHSIVSNSRKIQLSLKVHSFHQPWYTVHVASISLHSNIS